MKRIALLGFVLLFAAGSALAQPFTAGRDYQVLEAPQRTASPDRVEVREFFSYACPHCFSFTTPMHDWLEQNQVEIDFVRSPVVFNDSWRPLAQAFHTAEVLGVAERTHMALFTAIHTENKRFRNEQALADFFVGHGVEKDDFLRAYNSFAVDSKMRQSAQAQRNFKIASTPNVAINGKYVVDPQSAGNHQRMIQIIDYLVKKEAQ